MNLPPKYRMILVWQTGTKLLSSSRTRHPITDPQVAKCDCVGPPDKGSNIRPYKYYIPEDETPLEALFRHKKEELQGWNKDFWTTHNSKFKQEKEEFMNQKLLEKYGNQQNETTTKFLSAEEMSLFYKRFLDENYETHKNYNLTWYKKNIENLRLAFRVSVQRNLRKFKLKS